MESTPCHCHDAQVMRLYFGLNPIHLIDLPLNSGYDTADYTTLYRNNLKENVSTLTRSPPYGAFRHKENLPCSI